MFDRWRTIFATRYLKQHVEYFNFRCKIELDHPVHMLAGVGRMDGRADRSSWQRFYGRSVALRAKKGNISAGRTRDI